MLRITQQTNAEGVTLRLEGKLLGPWAEEVTASLGAVRDCDHITLDLEGLSFVDDAGVAVLRDLHRQGVRFVNASMFMAEILQLEDV